MKSNIIGLALIAYLFIMMDNTLISQESGIFDYEIEFADFNSEYSDFYAMYFGDEIIYISDRNSRKFVNCYDERTSRHFCNYYSPGEDDKVQSLIKHLNTCRHEGPLTVNQDLDLVFFTRTSKSKKLNIYYVKYENGSWSEEYEFPVNDPSYSVGHPSLCPEERYVYFASDMPGGFGGTDIYRIKYNSGNWGDPENLGGNINSSYNELFPFIRLDNVLFFSSDDKSGFGGRDLYKAYPEKDHFESRILLGEPFNSKFDDFAYFSSVNIDDGLEIGFFSSDRPGGIGSDDIYRFSALTETLLIAEVVEEEIEEIEIEKIFEEIDISSLVEASDDGRLMFKTVYFEFDDVVILPEYIGELDKISDFLNSNPAIMMKVSAHTDSRGTTQYNIGLSERRAASVIKYLHERMKNPDQVYGKGYGDSQIINHCVNGVECSDDEHRVNRRAEFEIITE